MSAPYGTFPNRGPYDPMYENMPSPGDGMVHHQFPWDSKYMNDPEYYDTLGRSLVEQRGVFTKNFPDETQVEMIKEILEAHPTDSQGDDRIWSIGLEAAMKGSGAVMGYLVRGRGLKVENCPESVGTLDVEMFHAAYRGYVDVMEILVDEAGMSVNMERDEETPLVKALLGGQVEMVKWLLGRGAECTTVRQALRCAVRSGKIELVELVLEKAKSEDPTKTHVEGDLLGEAAMTASEEIMRFIIDNGNYSLAESATPEQRLIALDAMVMSLKNDKTNQTCLQLAIERGLPKDSSGTYIKLPPDDEMLKNFKIAIGISCNRGKHSDLLQILDLLFSCTSIQKDSEDFRKMMNHAIRRCYDPIAKDCAFELIENWGADPDAHDESQDWVTALAAGAVGRGDPAWTQFWIDQGADIHRGVGELCNGPTALAQAVKLREKGNVMCLLENGGPVDKMAGIEEMVGKKELRISVVGRYWEAVMEDGRVELSAVPEEEQDEEEDAEDENREDADEDQEEYDAVDANGKDEKSSEQRQDEDDDDDGDEDGEPPTKQAKIEKRETIDMILEFEDGVTEEWLKKVQLRKLGPELLKDGTGRPLREDRGVRHESRLKSSKHTGDD